MSMHLAVVGKGGAGKSMLAGTLARMLARRGHRVLTLDSDLMPGLTLSLGCGIEETAMLLDAVERNDEGRWRLKKGIGPYRAVSRYAAVAPDGVRHLQVGKMDTGGQPAFHGSVVGYMHVVDRLSRSHSFDDWTIIGDLAAGPRHLTFPLAQYASTFLVIVEPSWKSALTARRLARIIREGPKAAVMPIASKVTGPEDRALVEHMLGEPVAAEIPIDPAVHVAERAGVAPIDHDPSSPAMRAIASVADALESAHGL